MQETSSQPGSTSVQIDADWLLREMRRRGLNQVGLALEAEVSQPTISAALRGEPISLRSAKAIREAIARVQPIAGMDDLVVAQ